MAVGGSCLNDSGERESTLNDWLEMSVTGCD